MNDTQSRNAFHKTIRVASGHLDAQNHVNNAVYVQWIQEIAVEHWRDRAGDGDFGAYWVVLEHQIQYKRQAFLDESLAVETFVEPPKGIRFPRVVNFRRDDELIVTARTLWCWIDANSHRPKRIPQEIVDLFWV